ncbi:hypothetical protein FSP39_019937 [Pinctada imbricata]|uniref:Caspase-3 n=1 Tax=Pinctada imbricata TaxID=66713 RepID=A0AA89BRJ4_PINIB|nr:hypothetical protein FSP39_019937 [Pinctada imbricata]
MISVFDLIFRNTPAPGTVVQTRAELFAHAYKMDYNRRGVALIINNKKFHHSTGLNDRNGTDVDASALACRFSELGFEPEIRHNQSAKEMKDTISQFATVDHTDADCFACAILSHGEEGTVWGTDRQIKVDDILAPFKGDVCASLTGKPKLFFIQACRGTKFDSGADMNVADAIGFMDEDVAMQTHRIPAEADFLVAYSVVPGFYSWRNSADGSWFVQALSRVLEEHGTELDLLTMMTRVNQKVALQFQSTTSNPNLSGKKQIPCVTSMLTKDVYFIPKS